MTSLIKTRLYAGANILADLVQRRAGYIRAVFEPSVNLDALSPAARLLAEALSGRDPESRDDLLRVTIRLEHALTNDDYRRRHPAVWTEWVQAARRHGCGTVEEWDALVADVYGDAGHLDRAATVEVRIPLWDRAMDPTPEAALNRAVAAWASAGWVNITAEWEGVGGHVRRTAAIAAAVPPQPEMTPEPKTIAD